MTPTAFWGTLWNALLQFYLNTARYVLVPLFNSMLSNVFLLLIFGFIILGICINIFRSLL